MILAATTLTESIVAFAPIIFFLLMLAVFFRFITKKQKSLLDRNMEYLRDNNAALKEIATQLKRLADLNDKNI